jgi:hypothetical protein
MLNGSDALTRDGLFLIKKKVSPSLPPVILCDNQSSIFLAVNPDSHKRSKHIDLDYHFVRESELRVRYVPTPLQLADMFITTP